jgi:tRNA (guanine-N7-)-methyltransferase
VPKNKHRKFSDINSFPNVVQPGYKFPVSDHYLKGNWNTQFFYNNNPIILEIGCGKGEYTIALAKAYPDYNFLGIDIKGDRLWKGAHESMESAITNVGFLRIRAEHTPCFFSTNEVAGIWITFPDPQPNKPRERKRLTSPEFLTRYRGFLQPDAVIHLKTDNKNFYNYTLETIDSQSAKILTATDNLYENPGDVDPISLQIQTYYEKIYLARGEKICYLKFSL